MESERERRGEERRGEEGGGDEKDTTLHKAFSPSEGG